MLGITLRQQMKPYLTISLDYATIKEWYYLVKEQGKFPEDRRVQDNAKANDEGGE